MAGQSSSSMLPSIREMLPGYFDSDNHAIPADASFPGPPSQSNHDELRTNAEPTSSDARRANFKYACPTCHKRFKRPSSLRVHLVCHTKEKPYKCDIPDCEKRFSTRSNMIRHTRKHHWQMRQRSEAKSGDVATSPFTEDNNIVPSPRIPELAGPPTKISLFDSLTLPPLPEEPLFRRCS